MHQVHLDIFKLRLGVGFGIRNDLDAVQSARALRFKGLFEGFDARFFMADADDALIDDRPPIDGRELNDLRWFTLPEVADLDLPNVTRFVISEVEARLVKREALRPFYLYWAPSGHVRERI